MPFCLRNQPGWPPLAKLSLTIASASLKVGLNMNDLLRISSNSHTLIREFLEVRLRIGFLKAVGTSKHIDLFTTFGPQVGYILPEWFPEALGFMGVNATSWGYLFGESEFLLSRFINN